MDDLSLELFYKNQLKYLARAEKSWAVQPLPWEVFQPWNISCKVWMTMCQYTCLPLERTNRWGRHWPFQPTLLSRPLSAHFPGACLAKQSQASHQGLICGEQCPEPCPVFRFPLVLWNSLDSGLVPWTREQSYPPSSCNVLDAKQRAVSCWPKNWQMHFWKMCSPTFGSTALKGSSSKYTSALA